MTPDSMPRYRHAQIAELATMFGEAEPLAVVPVANTAPTFTHVAGTLTPTPAGGLSWVPPAFPDWATSAGPDATELHVLIAHTGLGRTCPRRPDTIKELRADVERFGPRLGIYRVPIEIEPRRWTVHTIRELIERVLPLVPTDDLSLRKVDARINVYLGNDSYVRGHRHSRIEIQHGSAEHEFRATLRVDLKATAAIREWLDVMPGTFCEINHGNLAIVDEVLNGPSHGSSTREEDTVAPGADPEEDDDDDLDSIEKAARRALHGEKNIPKTSRKTAPAAPTADDEVADYENFIKAYTDAIGAVSRLRSLKCREIVMTAYLNAITKTCEALAKSDHGGER